MVAFRLRLVVGCTLVFAASLTVAWPLYAQYSQNGPSTPQSSYPPYTEPNFAIPPGMPGSPGSQNLDSPEFYEQQDRSGTPKRPPQRSADGSAGYSGAIAVPKGSQPLPPTAGERIVKSIRFEGNHTTDVAKLQKLNTRIGQPYDQRLVLEDVRNLNSDRHFLDAKVQLRDLPDGVEVIFQVVERSMLQDVIFVGNQDRTNRKLLKQSELQKGGALDPYQVEEARRRLETEYRAQGYPHASVKVIEGNDLKDAKAVLSVHEGTQEKIFWTSFEGNTIASDGRLRTQIQTSRSVLWVFGGKVDRSKIEEDVQRLTSYYRSLGFFDAKVGRILEYSESKKWLTVRFIINEGQRYSIRNVSFLGNEKFTNDTLNKDLVLKSGVPFNQDSLNKDAALLRDIYGGHGYIFADVQPETRLLEEKPEVDLVYDIQEGRRYRAGQVKINIGGEHPHTAHQVILERMSIKPGDIIDTRKLREDERRIGFAQVFESDPTKGGPPKFILARPDNENSELAEEPRRTSPTPRTGSESAPNYRGQSPDDAVEMDIFYVRDQSGVRTFLRDSVGAVRRVLWPEQEASRPQSLENAKVRAQSPDRSGSNWSAAPNNYWKNYNPNTPGQPASSWGAHDQSVEPPATVRTAANSSPYLPSGSQPLPPNMATSPPGAYQKTTPPISSPAPTFPSNTAPAYPRSTPISPAISTPAPNYTGTPAYPQSAPTATVAAPTTAPFDPYANPQPPGFNQPVYSPPAGGGTVFGGPAYENPQPYVVQQQPAFGDSLVTPPGGAAGQPSPLDPGTGAISNAPIFSPPTDPTIPLEINPSERQTGRLMLGVGVNSDAGLIGNFVLDEQNFDITRLPRSWEDIRNGTAWRGMGQRFRLEANPGTVVQRYAVTFQEPYLFGTPNQLNVSGYYFTRIYRDWSEERLGGKVGVGRLITADFSVRASFRGERVTVFNPRSTTVEQLKEVVGGNDLYGFGVGASQDTRDSPFLPTQGHLLSADFEQVVGSFQYPRVILEGRQYYLLRQRADGSGRHTLSVGSVFGVTGSDTPIYDNFFAGGFSTLRGFQFRGASPVVQGIQVGGRLEWLNTVEYMFPITADDALRGVISCDFGTVEQNVAINRNQFRVAPGFGLRINVPAMGPAPLAFDFNFPVAFAETDTKQIFAFFVSTGH
ncbi:MAG: BamA/TamA family outer membrane protein [Pirellulales bacterium]|nr:BamA/TamA family outer membrane protein [Pirellulales bacterium]